MDPQYHSLVRRDVIPFVPECERLLDVGGGFGGTAKALKQEGRARQIGVWDAVAPSDDPEIDFTATDDLNDESAIGEFFAKHGNVDVILFLDLLEHLVDPWSVLRNFSQYVRPGGAIVASIPNVRHIEVSGKLLFRNQWTYADAGILDRTHLRFFVRESAIDLMTLPGYSIELVTMSPIGSRLYKLINAVTFNTLRSFFSNQYFIVARRLPEGAETSATKA